MGRMENSRTLTFLYTKQPLRSTLCRVPAVTAFSLSVGRVVQPVRGAPVHINVGPRLARQVLWIFPPACSHQVDETGLLSSRMSNHGIGQLCSFVPCLHLCIVCYNLLKPPNAC